MIPVRSDLVELVNVEDDKDKDYLIKELRYLRKEEVKNKIIDKVENMLKVLSNEKHSDYIFFKSLCGCFDILEKECDSWKN